jgi:hypothetical protein
MKMEQIECSETSAYKIQTPGNYPEENIQHTEHGESLKSRIHIITLSSLVSQYKCRRIPRLLSLLTVDIGRNIKRREIFSVYGLSQ